MFESLSQDALPSGSKIFKDFIINRQSQNYSAIDELFINLKENNYDRDCLIRAITDSHNIIQFDDLQSVNVSKLKNLDTFAVVTGQQAGFLGGPLYTLLKALDTVKISNDLSIRYPDYNFVPIFWIEDNDNDVNEVASSKIFDEHGDPKTYSLYVEANKTVAKCTVRESDNGQIAEVCAMFDSLYPNGNEVSEWIREIYTEGKSWSSAFTEVLNRLCKNTGLLFLSADRLIQTGIFRELLAKELSEPGFTRTLIEKSNHRLIESGYHIQAQASEINLFYHTGEQRHRIEFSDGKFISDDLVFSADEFISLVHESPNLFSPKVLLRPIFQDYAIPTVAYLAGPGEIAYHSQIVDLYSYFGVIKPKLLMRTNLTCIDKKSVRYLSKLDIEPQYFFRKFSLIEHEIADKLLGERHEEIFHDFREHFEKNFKELEKYLLTIDSQLERSITTAQSKIIEQIEQLDKKAHALAKRNNEELLSKYKYLHNFLFPNSNYQEREISALYFYAISEGFINKLNDLKYKIDGSHVFLEL